MGYALFRRLWREERTTWEGRFRPPLQSAEVWPPPRQQPIRGWHGSATSRDSVELAARYGDPLFSATVTSPVEPYAELGALPRALGSTRPRPDDAVVGAGTAAFHVAATSQQAVEEYRPIFAQRLAFAERFGLPVVFPTVEDFVARSSALVGSPQQIVDKVLRYHEALGHEVIHLHIDGDGLTPRRQREVLEQFQADIAPVLRATIPSRPFASPVLPDADDARPVDAQSADEPLAAAS